MLTTKRYLDVFLHIKGWAFLLLILALATSAFLPTPSAIIHAGGVISSAPSSAKAIPGAFNKSSPIDGAIKQPSNTTLKWGTSLNAKSYQYCFSSTAPTSSTTPCSTWKSAGAKTNVTLSALAQGTKYYWQVRAVNGSNITYANGSAYTDWWTFTTAPGPGAFTKTTPTSGATDQPDFVTLSWSSSLNATDYQYCIDKTNNNACNGAWISTAGETHVAMSALIPDTWYYWQVRAVNGTTPTYADGSTIAWWHFEVSKDPGSFGKTSPVNGATNQGSTLTLTWGTSLNITAYEYCIDTNDNDLCDSSWTSVGVKTSITLSNLTPAVPYYWQVRAKNSTGILTYADGGSTAWWSFSTIPFPGDFAKLSPVSGTTSGPTNPTLRWNSSSGASSYEYCIDTVNNSSCDTSWISTSDNTSITVSSLVLGTKYFWQVRAKNASGTTYSTDSGSPIWWTYKVATLPAAFYKQHPYNGATKDPQDVWVGWTDSSDDVTEYQYCIDTIDDNTCNGHWIAADSGDYVDPLSQSTTYYWQVRAKNAVGTTYADGGGWFHFTTSVTPGAFNKTGPADGEIDQPSNIILSWNTSANALGYQYCIDTLNNDDCDASWTSSGGATSVTVSSLNPNTWYYWQVRASAGGSLTYADGSEYAWYSFKVGPLPGAFGKTSPTNGAQNLVILMPLPSGALSQPSVNIGVTLKWEASDGAASYAFCIDTQDNDKCDDSWVSTGAATFVLKKTLSPGTTYYWQVRAKNSAGYTYADGSDTAWWSFSISPE